MLALVFCAVCISLSELVAPKEISKVVEVKLSEITTPIHTAVLSALFMPLSCAGFAFLVKYVNVNLKLRANDFSAAYWFIMSLVVQIIAIVYFVKIEGFFDIYDWIRGSLASVSNLVGCGFIVAAFASDGAPYGAIAAGTQA